jgi:Putative zinc-finger
MNEKKKAEGLHEATTRARGCDRAEELVTYLYGETAPAEAHEFRRHLDACAVCREELSAFGAVREAVGDWRADALSVPPSLELHEAFARAPLAPKAAPRERSALAALREFFSLSPLWLKAGACAATLGVCALAALTFARTEVRWDANGLAFRTGVRAESPSPNPVEKNVEASAPNGYTKEQVEEVVKQRLEVARAEWESKQQPPTLEEVKDGRRKSPPQLQAASGSTPPRRKRAAPRSPRRDSQNFEDEDTLPRLSDLLGDAY